MSQDGSSDDDAADGTLFDSSAIVGLSDVYPEGLLPSTIGPRTHNSFSFSRQAFPWLSLGHFA